MGFTPTSFPSIVASFETDTTNEDHFTGEAVGLDKVACIFSTPKPLALTLRLSPASANASREMVLELSLPPFLCDPVRRPKTRSGALDHGSQVANRCLPLNLQSVYLILYLHPYSSCTRVSIADVVMSFLACFRMLVVDLLASYTFLLSPVGGVLSFHVDRLPCLPSIYRPLAI